MKQRLLIGTAALAALALALPQIRGAQGQMNGVKDSPVYSGVLVKDQGNGQVYRITMKNGQIVSAKSNRNDVEAR